jgi:GntR family transcriptional regulator/MocR family aminotransferase
MVQEIVLGLKILNWLGVIMLRLWELNISLSQNSGVAVYMQIVQKIIEEIKVGRLKPSTAMPSTRDLATNLKVNRKTVVLAYEELVAQGWLSTEKRRGTFVSANLPKFTSLEHLPSHHFEGNLATSSSLYIQQPVRQKAQTLSNNTIDFNDGIPDARLIPFEVLSRAFRHALVGTLRVNCLSYDSPRGMFSLRQSIATMLNIERGLHVDVDTICIVRGSQMGIFLAARVLVRPNDVVVLENLTYPPARDAFKSCGANVLSVGVDEHGLKVGELELLCKKQKIRAVYVTPHHQFPTTVTMTAERRLKLLILAEQYDFVIIEDDYDHEFHFEHHPALPLASTDDSGRVVYVGSMSKVLAPGLRIGYLVASAAFIDRCATEIMLIDRQGNSVTELVVSELIDTGEVKRHIRRTFKIYHERRNLLEQLLLNELSTFVSFDMPQGGLAFWLRLTQNVNLEDLVTCAAKENVRILPGSLFMDNGSTIQAIRMGFGSLSNTELTQGVQRLKIAFQALQSKGFH